MYACLFSSVPVASAASDPRDGMSNGPTEIQCGFVNGQIVDRSPEFQLIAVGAAFVAVVTSTAQVDGERATPRARRAVDGAWSTELVPKASDRLEAETIEHLLHRDLGTQPGEVDPGHGFLPAPVFAHRRTAE